MRARDVIVIARRRAGLGQLQLGQRLGVPQSTVARWESGATEPKFEMVQKVVAACGLDLMLGLASADGGSWMPLIYEQLARRPADRLRRLTHDGFDRVAALELIATLGVRAIVIGEAAGALHGWPLILSEQGTVDLVPHPADRELITETAIAAALEPERLRLIDIPAGTRGFADLARAARKIDIDGVAVTVAALVDLLRIALSDPAPHSQRFALALDATLQLTQRTPSAAKTRKLSAGQARAQADAWLSKQTA